MADPAEAIVDPTASAPVVRTRGGAGVAFAIILALLALLVAAHPVVFPIVRPWLLAEYGSNPVVQALLRRAPEPVVKQEMVDALVVRLATMTTRLEASEGRIQGAVGRLTAVEDGLATLNGKVQGLTPGVPADGAAASRPETMEAWAVSANARIESLEKDHGGTVGRVSRLESALDVVLRRPEAPPPPPPPAPAPGVPPARVEALETGIAAVQERLAKVETGLGGAVATAGRIDELAPAVTAASGRLGTVEGRMTTVEDRLTQAVDGRASMRQSLRAAQVSLALLQLNAVAQTHKPFAREVEVARGLANGNGSVVAQLNLIADVAQTGVATTAELRDSFATIVVPKIQSVAGSDRPLTDRVRAWLSTAIAPTGAATTTPDRDPTAEIVDAATQKLAEDDVAGAVQQLGQLEGPAATLASRWMTEARARLAIDSACDALGGLVLELLGNHDS
ncbi:MAG: MICOS complex subunit MIC60 [Alphaproteobacteria bacterium]